MSHFVVWIEEGMVLLSAGKERLVSVVGTDCECGTAAEKTMSRKRPRTKRACWWNIDIRSKALLVSWQFPCREESVGVQIMRSKFSL